MTTRRQKPVIKRKVIKGRGLVNTIINKLPIELHLPGYQYCGPGTKLEKRLANGDPGINPLDAACKEHDIAYSKHKNLNDRHIADKILEEKAWQRVISKDSNLSERASSLLVTNLMKAKTKFGLGIMSPKKNKKVTKKSKFTSTFQKIKKEVKSKNPKNIDESIKVALAAAKKILNGKNNKLFKTARIIPVPKVGGIIPFLIPLFAGLSAVGALSGGAAGIARAVNQASSAKKKLSEMKRHNETMESIAIGRGLYLKPYKKGFGLYLAPQTKNF